MAFDNQQVLSQIVNPAEKAVFKSMREDMATGKALLNPEQLGTFLRAATLNQTILRDATFDLLQRTEKEYVETDINGRVIQPGYKQNGKTNDELDAAEVKWEPTVLKTTKLKSMCSIEDDDKEDNLEQAAFEQTLLTMMGERWGEDMEVWTLFADTDKYEKTNFLGLADGWLKNAANHIQSAGVQTETNEGNADFDPINKTVEDIFDRALYAMPIRWRQRANLKFYVPFEIEDAYRNLLKSRGTPLGDQTQTGYAPLTYKKIPIINCESLDAEDIREDMDTTHVMLTQPQHLLYGIYKNVSIEPDRIVKHERTDYYYRFRGGVNTKYAGKPTVDCELTLDELAELPELSKF